VIIVYHPGLENKWHENAIRTFKKERKVFFFSFWLLSEKKLRDCSKNIALPD